MEVRAPRSAKAPRRARGKQRVETLLDAAEQLFAEMGYGAVAMNAIARRAGAPVGSLYQFFPNKPSMASALIERYMTEIVGCWRTLDVAARTLDYDAFAEMLVDETLDTISRQAAFSTLDEAQNNLSLRPENHDEAAAGLAALLAELEPKVPGDVRLKLAVMTLQLLKGAYALEKGGATALNPRHETALLIAGYLRLYMGAAGR